MHIFRLLLTCGLAAVLAACGEDAPPQAQVPQAAPAVVSPSPNLGAVPASADYSTGGVSAQILPENPTSTGCLRVIIQGVPGRAAISWEVNDQALAGRVGSELCSDSYKRGDRVTAHVGTRDQGASATVIIGNSPPQVVGMTATPDRVLAGTTIQVVPQAEDADGDEVSFRYQWSINGYADAVLIDPFLPGEKVSRGDRLQLQITPSDRFSEGAAYVVDVQPIPNAPPVITSKPPEGITSLDYRYQVEVTDPDDSTFTFRLADAPNGMRIGEKNGLIEWSLVGVAPGDYTITIIAADPMGAEAAQGYRLTLGAP